MCLEMKCNKIYHCALATRNATDLIDLMFICYIWQHKTQHDQNCHFSFRPTFKSSPDSKSDHTCEVKYILSYVLFIQYFCPLVFGILVTLVAWFSFRFFCLAHLALQNVNKDYVIFSYFCSFVAKSDQKPKTK